MKREAQNPLPRSLGTTCPGSRSSNSILSRSAQTKRSHGSVDPAFSSGQVFHPFPAISTAPEEEK